uniref:Uncharacterized protein n=1 Tax=Yersinia pseudotuberculosis serotype O:3 (strain YPIII) TaxID=502800 RepID=A0A0H3B0T1_YERPY
MAHDPIIFLSVIRVLAVKFPLTVKDETTLGSEETDTKGDAKV